MKLSPKYFNSNSVISDLLKIRPRDFFKKLIQNIYLNNLEQPFVYHLPKFQENLSCRSLVNRIDVKALSRDKPYTAEFKLKRTQGY